MTQTSQIINDYNNLLTKQGRPIRIRYYNITYSGADYDQEFVTASGTDVWAQGMPFPLQTETGGADRPYLEQGLITFGDKKLFLPGSITVNSLTKLMFGSPNVTETYAPIQNGWIQQQLTGSVIFSKVFIRTLNNGSFIGEI